MPLVLWTSVIALSCIAGAALFQLAWPSDRKADGRHAAAVTIVVLSLVVGGIAGFMLLLSTFPHESQTRWLSTGAWGGAAVTGMLLAAWAVGDRSRGRRRCPKCWYSMAGTPGLVCPECGRDARTERALFRARRPVRLVPIALVPVVACTALSTVAFLRLKDWPRLAPSWALAAAAPFARHDSKLAYEIRPHFSSGSVTISRPWSAWQRPLIAWAGRRAQAQTDADSVFYGAMVLFSLEADDENTTAALAALLTSRDRSAAETAAMLLGNVRSDAVTARAALCAMADRAFAAKDLYLTEGAVLGLLRLQPRFPGGTPPDALLRIAEGGTFIDSDLAHQALRYFDTGPEVRRVLVTATQRRAGQAHAVASLATLEPGDDDTHRAVLAALNTDTDAARHHTILALAAAERWIETQSPARVAGRSALYSPEVCAQLERQLDSYGEKSPWRPSAADQAILRARIADARRARGEK